jgi:hypothetical protein
MHQSPRRRRAWRSLRLLAAAAVAALLTVATAGAVSSRSAVAPSNNSLPSISGTMSVGSTATANPGTWSGSTPISFQYQWRICGADGGACRDIGGATSQTYQIRKEDPGNTLRVQVIASNADGSATATSAPSARIAPASGPVNTSPPTISGNVSVGSTLTADPGKWNGSGSITFKYQWRVCGADGGACRDIGGATAQTYQVQKEDPGNTLRVVVTATDATGSASATSAPTTRVAAAAAAAPAPTGCPKLAAGAQAASVNDVAPPARLQIDQFVPSMKPITRGMTSFTVRFHVGDTCGQAVSGAVVYATAVPYDQVTTPGEATTDGTGWATLTFNRLSNFPAARQQQLMVMFVRARKAGDPLLAGISTRRLISLPVDLRR